MKKHKRLKLGVVAVLLLCGVCWAYAADFYRADDIAMAAISSAATVTVVQKGNTLDFIPEDAETGLIFYPGGKVEYVNLIPSTFRKALEDAGFNYAKAVRGFVSRGWFESFIDTEGKKRSQYQCKIDGVNMRVFRCKMKVGPDDSSEDDFLE